jgi:hypothetical protein
MDFVFGRAFGTLAALCRFFHVVHRGIGDGVAQVPQLLAEDLHLGLQELG